MRFIVLAGCALAVAASASWALAAGSEADSTDEQTASPALLEMLESPPGLREQAEKAGEDKPLTPEESVALTESRQKFRDLAADEAAQAAKQQFPEILNQPAYRQPELNQDEHIVGYPAPNVAQLELPSEEHAVLETQLPLITPAASGKEEPVDLALSESEKTIEPVNPLTPVEIPQQLSEGITLPESGVTLTPVDGEDQPLAGSIGSIEGDTAFYANTQTDTDTLAKPLPEGFETQTILRSPASPQKLYFRLSGKGDLKLTQAPDGSIAVEEQGQAVAAVGPVAAVDAAGNPVPVSMELEGARLVLTIQHREAEYQYPIDVDPTVTEHNYGISEQGPWFFTTNDPEDFVSPFTAGHPAFPTVYTELSYVYGQYGAWNYQTQGSSRIYEYEPYIWSAFAGDQMENFVGIAGPGGVSQWLGTYIYPQQTFAQCAAAGCASTGGSAGNAAFYEKVAINSGTGTNGIAQNLGVRIAQDTGPSLQFDTADKEVEGHLNPLYGSGVWLRSSDAGRLKAQATDPGIGIYKRKLISTTYSSWNERIEEGPAVGCKGVQCNENYTMVTNVGNLPEGSNTVVAQVENATSAFKLISTQVKVDNTSPYASVSGLPGNVTLSRGSVHKLEFNLSDGKAPTASSGVAAGKSEVLIDGEQVLGKTGAPGCSPGPCSTTRTYELNTRGESSGVHTIEILVEDGVGNSSVTEFPFVIKAGPSEQMGPGSLDLASGEYSLSATDVSPASAGAGLSLARSYKSQSLPVTGSPFGSSWQMSIGGWQGVNRLSDGSAVFTDARGRSILFESAKAGGYVNPPGYQGWSLNYSEGFQSAFGTTGTGNGQFKSPRGVALDPKGNILVVDYENNRIEKFNEKGEYASQFGTKGSGNGQLSSPTAIAVDSKGNAWVLDMGNARVEEFNEKGEYVTKFGTSGSGSGQLLLPFGIAVDSKGNVWVADTFNNRVEEFSEAGTFIKAIGWGVSNGEAKLQVCTSSCQAGKSGSGNGQLTTPSGIALDSKGNVYVVDQGNNRIEKFNEKGEYVSQFGTTGSGNGQLKSPRGIALDSKGNAWVVDGENSRVEEFNEKGEYAGQFGAKGTGNGQFSELRGGIAADSKGNFWVSDSGNNRVEKWTPAPPSFTLTDVQGDVTTFQQPGGKGELFLPSSSSGPNGTGSTTFQFEVVEGVARPTQVLGPVPAGVSCTTLVRGCRALTFAYDVSTTATSNEPSGWGSYKGRLGSVELHAWNPETGSMVAIPVADYSYDSQGRLRAAWDPRISPALKTLYGYDSAGHVTALTPPGQQTWSMNYGTIGADTHTDWLLSVSRTKASTTLGTGEAPKNTEVPTLSNTYPLVGTTYRVWNGTWTNAPTSYSYQWSDCNSAGEGCVAIPGATNQSYTPVSGDLGHRLVATVTAANAGGSATASSAASSEVVATPTPVYSSKFGATGTGNGQFKMPKGIAVDSKGNIWVVDSTNNRIEKFNEAGEYVSQFGTTGSGNGQFSNPTGIAVNSSGNLWVVDTGNNRVEKFNEKGEYLSQFGTTGTGNGQFKSPRTIAIDVEGRLWVTDYENNRIEQFNEKGEYLRKAGTTGSGNGQFSGPIGLAIAAKTNVYVVDSGNNRVEKFNQLGEYLSQFGTKGSGNGQLNAPQAPVVDSKGNVWVLDRENNRVEEFNEKGEFVITFAKAGLENGQLFLPNGIAADSKGNFWVSDTSNRIQKWFTPSTTQNNPPPPDPTTAVWTAIYHVPVSGSGAPYTMDSATVAKWAQSDTPIEATAIFPPDEVPSRPPADYKRASVYYMDNSGNAVDTVAPGGRVTTNEFDEDENLVRSLSAANQVTALEAGSGSAAKSESLDTQFTYSSDGTNLLSVLGPKHKVKLASGKEVEARLHTQYTYDQGAPEGGPYHLVTTETEGAQIAGEADADVRTKTYSYSGQSNLGWSFREPTSTTTDPGGLNLISTTVYDPITGNVTEVSKPGHPEGGDAHSTRTIYYSAKTAEPKACGEHPEWTNLPCETLPAAQPKTPGLPELPVATTKYNIWEEPTTTTETSGSETRSATVSYDGAGRPTTSEMSASSGVARPAVSLAYSSTLGVPTTVSATGTKGFEAVTTEYNSLGQLTSYTDAGGNVSTYAYDIDGRPTETNDGKGTQTSTYDSTTGELTSLKDSAVGTFTAIYDSQGHMVTEKYPNGMTATYAYDSTGAPIKLTDVKTTHCTEACTWYSDEVTPSIHGQWLKQVSTKASQGYAYDAAGRLTQAQETPVGEGCTTTINGYDADTNRTSMVTRAPKEGGACAESGGSTVTNSFDAADRLTDLGVSYDAFGDITELSAADAGGHALSSTYYVDGSLATQTQNGQTLAYALDPLGRDREVIASGSSASVTTSHFASNSDAPSWTVDESGNWTRYISGIDGSLGVIQQGAAEPQLQIADLHGDIVATAPLSETATGLTWKTETTATGVPRGGKPAKYGWLGFAKRPTELESGVVNMGSSSYVPQLGRYLQPTVVNHDSSAYSYASGDPVNEAELNGQYSPTVPAWLEQFEAHPPGMPPPPPPPAAESASEEEIIELMLKGGGGGGGGDDGTATASSLGSSFPFYIGPCGIKGKGADIQTDRYYNEVGIVEYYECTKTVTIWAFIKIPAGYPGAGPISEGVPPSAKRGFIYLYANFAGSPEGMEVCFLVITKEKAKRKCGTVGVSY